MYRSLLSAVLLPLWACPALAQAEGAAEEKPSLDDQLVRQVIERERIAPPRVGGGQPIGHANGSRALLVWQADSDLQLLRLERAETPRDGAPPEPPAVALEVEEEVAAPPAPRKKAAAKRLRRVAYLNAQVVRADGALTVRAGKGSFTCKGEPGDRAELVEMLRGQRLATKADQCVLVPGRGATVQDVLNACDAVWAAEFAGIALQGGGGEQLPAAAAELVQGLPEAMQWPKRPPGICDGEVLLLVDAQQPWGRLARLYERCAMAGIWQIGFVCEGAERRRVVVPLPIPVDQ